MISAEKCGSLGARASRPQFYRSGPEARAPRKKSGRARRTGPAACAGKRLPEEPLDGRLAAFVGADADSFVERQDENLAVANLARLGRFHDGVDGFARRIVG